MAEELVRTKNTGSQTSLVLGALKDLGSVLGVLEPDLVQRQQFNDLVNLLLDLRTEFRSKRDFATADRIRDDMSKTGIIIEDPE